MQAEGSRMKISRAGRISQPLRKFCNGSEIAFSLSLRNFAMIAKMRTDVPQKCTVTGKKNKKTFVFLFYKYIYIYIYINDFFLK